MIADSMLECISSPEYVFDIKETVVCFIAVATESIAYM